MRLLSKLEKSSDFWFLISTCFFFFLFRLPSLFEPQWYGDEGVYQVLGHAIRAGRLLYRDIWDNKPPLLYLLYALFNSDQFLIRLVSLIFGLASVIAFFYLSKTLFEKNIKLVFVTTALFAVFFGLPLVEGNIANAENFMLLPIILSALLILKATKGQLIIINYQLPIAGVLLSIAVLTKIVAIFDAVSFLLFFMFINISKLDFNNLKSEIKKLLPFFFGFTAPSIIVALFFLFNGAFVDFLQASFLQNVGYVGYGNKFIIAQGFLFLKLFILVSSLIFIFLNRPKFSKTFVFIFIWFLFSLFNSFFSQRPYTHYLLVLLPSFCLFIGLILYEARFRKLLSLIFLICFILIITNFWFYGKTIFYYQNFIAFITGSRSVSSYREFFDKATPIDYEISGFLKSHTTKNDGIFIWGNNAQVYAMTNKLPPSRYTVAYHITSYKNAISETQNAINSKKPKFIVVMPNQKTLPFPLLGYKERIKLENVLIYERIF